MNIMDVMILLYSDRWDSFSGRPSCLGRPEHRLRYGVSGRNRISQPGLIGEG